VISSGQTSVAVVMLGSRCNMFCNFCVTEDSLSAMPWEYAVDLLKSLRAEGVRTVVFGGGEPFDWPGDVVRLTQTARTLGFRTIQVGTNGVSLPDGYEYIDSIDRYVLPLESRFAEPHNTMRRYKGRHHAIILDRLERLGDVGKSVTISTVMTAMNVDAVVGVGEFLREYQCDSECVHAWHVYRFLPLGRGGGVNAEALNVSTEEYEQVFQSVLDMGLDFRVYRRADMYHSKMVDFFWYEDGRVLRGSEAWVESLL